MTTRLTRLFDLIEMLADKPMKLGHISKVVNRPIRTVHRDLHLIEDLGFAVDRDFENRYFINREVRPKFIEKFV